MLCWHLLALLVTVVVLVLALLPLVACGDVTPPAASVMRPSPARITRCRLERHGAAWGVRDLASTVWMPVEEGDTLYVLRPTQGPEGHASAAS